MEEFPEFLAASALSAAIWARSFSFSASSPAKRSDTATTKATNCSWAHPAATSAETGSLTGHPASTDAHWELTRTCARPVGYLNGYA